MPNPAVLYHVSNPQGQRYPDLTPELKTKLEGEGWVDSPGKLPEHLRSAYKGGGGAVQVPRPAPVEVSNAPGRVLGEAQLPPQVVDILQSVTAMGRLGQIFNDAFDLVCNIEDSPTYLDALALGAVIDAMSREEVIEAIQRLEGEDPHTTSFDEPWTSKLRAQLAETIRPGLGEATVEALVADAEEVEQGAGTGKGTTDHDSDGKMGGMKTVDPNPANWTLEQLRAATPELRDAWFNDAHKEHMTKHLDELDIAYKARANRDELEALLRDALNAVPPAGATGSDGVE